MGIPSTIESLSATIGSNDPTEGDGTPMTSVNDGLRAAYGFLRQSVSSGSDIASASTITPPSNGSSFTITGTTTITSISSTNSWNGRTIVFRHGGAHSFTNSASLVCLGGASTTFAAGDFSLWRQQSSGVWEMLASSVASNLSSGTIPLARLNVGTSAQFIRADGTVTATVAATLTAQNLTLTSSDSYLIPGATAFNLRNTASSSTNWRVTDGGIIHNPSGTQPSFAGVASAARTTAGTYTNYTESFDQNSNFNPTTGVFTCPITGLYFVSATIEFSCSGATPYFIAQIRQNATGISNISTTLSATSTTYSYNVNALVRAAATDTFSVYLDTISGGTSPTSTVSRFNGSLLF